MVLGVNGRGEKRFLGIDDGIRESAQSWREVLLGLKARGLTQAPLLVVGDGVLDGARGDSPADARRRGSTGDQPLSRAAA